jgi:hypothetical protein
VDACLLCSISSPTVLRRTVRDVRAPRIYKPASSIARLFASETIPASATTVISGRSWAVMKASITGSIVAVSALLPANASTIKGRTRR